MCLAFHYLFELIELSYKWTIEPEKKRKTRDNFAFGFEICEYKIDSEMGNFNFYIFIIILFYLNK